MKKIFGQSFPFSIRITGAIQSELTVARLRKGRHTVRQKQMILHTDSTGGNNRSFDSIRKYVNSSLFLNNRMLVEKEDA